VQRVRFAVRIGAYPLNASASPILVIDVPVAAIGFVMTCPKGNSIHPANGDCILVVERGW
jgi:hypothetical protein